MIAPSYKGNSSIKKESGVDKISIGLY